MAARYVRDVEAAGSNPATPTSSSSKSERVSGIDPEPFLIFDGPWGAKRGASHYADLAWLCWLKIVFMVSAPLVITGLSWCR